MAVPLLRLLRKGEEFKWQDEEEERKSFEKLKMAPSNPTLLSQPDFGRKFILTTDASSYGLGAILSQNFEEREKPIAYASRSLTATERRYEITEKEMLGLV